MTLVVLSFRVFMLGTLPKMEYCTQYVLPFNTTVQALPGSRYRKVIADCVITTTPIAFIFTTYCLFVFSMFFRFM